MWSRRGGDETRPDETWERETRHGKRETGNGNGKEERKNRGAVGLSSVVSRARGESQPSVGRRIKYRHRHRPDWGSQDGRQDQRRKRREREEGAWVGVGG